ncbi:WD repeat and FYVE domain-containing protein 3 [Sesbania bispinosa]|nr:WD repeat and FYVE domain-containing protein 3 [Sesbania bispinosa]
MGGLPNMLDVGLLLAWSVETATEGLACGGKDGVTTVPNQVTWWRTTRRERGRWRPERPAPRKNIILRLGGMPRSK